MRTYRRTHHKKAGFFDRLRKTIDGPAVAETRSPDYVLATLFGVLILFGLVMLSSASSVVSYREHENAYFFVFRQITRGFVPGLFALYVFSRFDYRKLEKYSVGFFVASLLLLLLVFIPGVGAEFGTSRSWIHIGFFTMQPAEVVKLFLIFSLAGWFAYRGRDLTADFWNGLVPFAVILGLISLPIILQPDIGTLSVVVTIAVAMYFMAGASWRHLFVIGLAGGAGFLLMVLAAPYRAARLMTFLNPEIDPQGVGYHINQALLAVGSGGLFGLGFGRSQQKFAYLPEVMGDSIFAIIAEELGFVFAVVLVALIVAIAMRALKMFKRCSDPFSRYLIVGIVVWFIFQSFYNIAAMIGLMPLTGIPLPFVSYGGTALLVSMAAAGLLLNISRSVKID